MAEPEAVEDVNAIVQPAISVLVLAQEGVVRQVAQRGAPLDASGPGPRAVAP